MPHEGIGTAAVKRLSPVELLESCIRRIQTVNPAVNAFVATCFDRAREEAQEAERLILRGDPLGPLHGLPIGFKDIDETAGLVTTHGSLLFKNHVPEKDERVVRAVKAAGGIVIGKTNTSEFAAAANTTNELYGATRNPFDLARTCGGSSGGSAVAVTTGMVPLATGSDAGGSLRNPAAFSGCVGFRPTPGLVPSDRRLIGHTSFYVLGPLARSVPDTALLLSAMAGEDHLDPLSAPLPTLSLNPPATIDLARLRVAVSEDLGMAPVDNGIRRTFRDRVDRFKSVFGACSDRDPDLASAHEVFWIWRGVHFLAAHNERCEKHPTEVGPMIRENVAAARKLKPEDVAWAKAEETRLYRKFQSFFNDIDVLIAPATSVPPFSIDRLYCAEINGKKLRRYVDWLAVTYAISLTEHPAITIPCGFDHTGAPFGIQIVGKRRADAMLLGIATALEGLFAADPKLARPVPDLTRLQLSDRAPQSVSN